MEHYMATRTAIVGNKILKQDWDRDSVKYRRMYLDTNRYRIKIDSSGNRLIIPTDLSNTPSPNYAPTYQNQALFKQPLLIQNNSKIETIDDKIRALDSLSSVSNTNTIANKTVQKTAVPPKPVYVPETYKHENDPDYFPTIALCIIGFLCMLILPAIIIFKKNKKK